MNLLVGEIMYVGQDTGAICNYKQKKPLFQILKLLFIYKSDILFREGETITLIRNGHISADCKFTADASSFDVSTNFILSQVVRRQTFYDYGSD